MKRKIVLFGIGFIVWCMLNWVPDWQHLLVGVFVAAFAAFMAGDLFIQRPYLLKNPKRYVYFVFHYLPVLLKEIVLANIDVAYRVIHPRLPITPGIVKVKTSLKSDVALTFLANSITLTPGTLSVDIDKAKGFLYVHWIDIQGKNIDKATEVIVERFEIILKKVFE